ncbi:hypothetical protein L2E82_02147 [Cichorium intybus]|uniref:Uncharacterized protein n=1 Tax=Cichorium intybus TaxID=13427 RepID=A0ACB9H0H0_CICIN|nr:hypothetical protein L2E82_02147 [Cichorium intybus]
MAQEAETALRVEMHAALRSPSPSKSPLVTLRQKRRRSLKKIKVWTWMLIKLLITQRMLNMIMKQLLMWNQKEVGSPELERGVVNAALDLYDVIQLDFVSANMR